MKKNLMIFTIVLALALVFAGCDRLQESTDNRNGDDIDGLGELALVQEAVELMELEETAVIIDSIENEFPEEDVDKLSQADEMLELEQMEELAILEEISELELLINELEQMEE